jgi:DNA-binding transcriptional ArsR family regulator
VGSANAFLAVPYPGAPAGDFDTYLKTGPDLPYPGFARCFANGLSARRAAMLAATQRPIAFIAGSAPSGVPGWQTIPSWSLIGTADHVIPPAEQLFMSQRAHARITEINAVHLSLISHPGAVTRVIIAAAQAACIVAAWACTNFRHVTSVGRGRVAVPARHSSHSPSCDAAGRRGVDAFRYRHMMAAMARAATTSDAFNAIAEPQRREILVLLQGGERPVTELARDLGMSQPQASKHLRVLREVGLVQGRRAGKQRLYGLDARVLRPVHEWLGGFERFWSGSFDRLDEYVQDLKQARREEPPVGDDQ